MIRRVMVRAGGVLILLLAATGSLPAETAKPVVLSMCTVADYTSNQRFDATSALRFQIVSKLVQNYDCLMVSRSMSDCLAFEQEIAQMKDVTSGKAGVNSTLAADYAIRIHLRRTDDNKGVRVFAIIKNLTRDLAKEPDRVIWDIPLDAIGKNENVREYGKLVDSVCDKIVEHLKLSPRTHQQKTNTATANAAPIWAVLPFEILDGTRVRELSAKQQYYKIIQEQVYPESMLGAVEEFWAIMEGTNSSFVSSVRPKNADAIRRMATFKVQMEKENEGIVSSSGNTYVNLCELALQDTHTCKVVDRTKIDQILKELKLGTLLGINESLGGYISRIAGADRLILGCVQKESAGFRLLLQLVDSATSSVIGAFDQLYPNEGDIAQAINESVKGFLQTTWSKPGMVVSTKEQRNTEGLFYYEFLPYTSPRATASYMVEWLDRSKIAYFLMRDEREFVRKYIIERFEAIVDQSTVDKTWRPYVGDPTQDVADSAAFYLDHILFSFEDDESVHVPLLRRAKAFEQTHFYDKALPLIVEHRKKYPNVSTGEALYVEARCRYRLGDIPGAKRLIQLAPESADFDLALDIARDSRAGDEKSEYLLLQKMPRCCGIDLVRFFQLTEKYDGIEKVLSLPHDEYEELAGVLKGDILFKQGKLEESVRMYTKRLKSEECKNNNRFAFLIKERIARVEALMGKSAQTADKVMELASIMKLPDKYKIYCYPITGSDSNVVKNAAEKIGAKFGTTVVIQAPVPLSKSTEYDKLRECYNFQDLSRRVLKEIDLPKDAVFVYIVTPVRFVPDTSEYNGATVGSPKACNPVFSAQSGGNSEQIFQFVSWSFLASVLYPLDNWDGKERDISYYSISKCGVTDCGYFATSRLCGKCAAKYNLSNFEKAYNALHAFMKRENKALSYTER